MIIATLLLLGIPTFIFLGLCTLGANLILEIIRALIEGADDVLKHDFDRIENNMKNKKNKK